MWTFMVRRVGCLLLVLIASLSVVRADDDASDKTEAEKLGAVIFEAFAAGDTEKLKASLPAKVLFLGEPRLIGIEPDGGLQKTPIDVEAEKLVAGYAKVIEKVGKEKWIEMTKKCKPTLEKATADGKPLPFVKAGDFVYDLHFREAIKGKARGLDEAILFVLRRVDGKFVVVGHFADL
jgi:hypothetical protein